MKITKKIVSAMLTAVLVMGLGSSLFAGTPVFAAAEELLWKNTPGDTQIINDASQISLVTRPYYVLIPDEEVSNLVDAKLAKDSLNIALSNANLAVVIKQEEVDAENLKLDPNTYATDFNTWLDNEPEDSNSPEYDVWFNNEPSEDDYYSASRMTALQSELEDLQQTVSGYELQVETATTTHESLRDALRTGIKPTPGYNKPSVKPATKKSEPTPAPVVKPYVPATPEEQVRYDVVGKVAPVVAPVLKADGSVAPVEVKNQLQGEKCHDVFNAFKPQNSKIAKTFTIFGDKASTAETPTYQTAEPLTITMTIPEGVAAGKYSMVCVSEKGMPFVFADEDSNPDTITFTTDRFYAYALVVE